ncbi:MAG TPA: flagellar biosynthesis repressor FlbT [Paracoccaceae bacterium]|nr:flagellar biosynthesis repressor FlbT [Paracoccaceae bacterium]
MTIRLSLRAGEKIYVNGAVLRTDRKTSIEILNDATFLLGQHVLQAEDATTPLRQLYFIAQTILMDPAGAKGCRLVFDETVRLLCETFDDAEILAGMETVGQLMDAGRTLDAMKGIRALLPLEDGILAGKSTTTEAA